MDDLNALVQEAIAAVKAGRKQEGRDKLLAVIERNDRHEQAWLGLSALVDTTEERIICLENVLAINPNNERAKSALSKLTGQPPSPPTPPPAPRPAPTIESSYDPFGSSSPEPYDPYRPAPFEGARESATPFGDTPFSDYASAGGAEEAEDDVPDWYKPIALQDEGQVVEEVSRDQYDQWMERRNLNPGADSSLNESFGDNPFGGDSPFEAPPAPWDDLPPAADFSPADTPWSASSPFDEPDDDPFAHVPSVSPFDREPVAQPVVPTPVSSPFSFDSASEDDADDEEESFSFDFDDDPSPVAASAPSNWMTPSSAPSTPFSGVTFGTTSSAAAPRSSVTASAASAASTASAASPSVQALFQQIPADIEAVPPGQMSRQRVFLMFAILVLLVLNAASIGLLVTTL